MYDRILARIRDKVTAGECVMTLHAEEEMESDALTIWDVEHCVFTGVIVERQRESLTGESKYRLRGRTRGGEWIEVILKFGHTGKVVFITVYLA